LKAENYEGAHDFLLARGVPRLVDREKIIKKLLPWEGWVPPPLARPRARPRPVSPARAPSRPPPSAVWLGGEPGEERCRPLRGVCRASS
jgi:hypothetical protein